MLRSLFVVMLLPAVAAAAPTISGDATEAVITIPGATPEGRVRASGDRIEIPVAVGITPSKTYFGRDITVRKVEVIAGDAPRVSVQVRHSQGTTEILAAATKLVETPDGIQLVIPRDKKVAAEPPAVTVAPAAVQVKTAAVQVKTVPVAAPALAPSPAPVPAPAPEPVVVTEPTPPPPPAPAVAAAPPRLTGTPTATPPPAIAGMPATSAAASSTRLMILIAILGACGAVYFVVRRRRDAAKPGVTSSNIEVLASRQLGGKTRAVLLSVNDSQMLLAVSDQGARLLGQWFADDDGARIAERDILSDAPLMPMKSDTEPQAPIGVRRPSAAVAGLIRLKREGDARFTADVARALREGRR